MRNVIEGDNLRWLSLQVDDIQLFVLDEEDEMLSHGFKEQIYDIFKVFDAKRASGSVLRHDGS